MLFVTALTGLVLGHLFDLIYERFFTGTPISEPLSRCSNCRSALRPMFTVPLVGIVASGGACPDCGARLPWRAMILPLGSAALFALSYEVFDEFSTALLAGFFASVFLLLTMTDLDRRLLPNRIVYPSIVAAVALSWAWPESSVIEILAGGAVAVGIAVFLLLFSLLFGENAFGMGDVKMIVLIGFVVGIPAVGIAVVLGTFAGGIGAGALMGLRLKSRRDYIAHGPFLALGAVIALFWGQDIWDWYVDS